MKNELDVQLERFERCKNVWNMAADEGTTFEQSSPVIPWKKLATPFKQGIYENNKVWPALLKLGASFYFSVI